MTEYSFTPIGVFHSDAHYPYDLPRQGILADGNPGYVELAEGRGLAEAAADLAGFSRIWLLFLFDRNVGVWHPKVQPPRHSERKIGVFATRSPYRPNPIGLTCAEVVEVKGNIIRVKSHDLLDGTPILDIKPYLPYADAFPEATCGWTREHGAQYQVVVEEVAERQLEWLAEKGLRCLRQFLQTRLEDEPLNKRRNRLIINDLQYNSETLLAYRTWRIAFTVDEAAKVVRVHRLLTGYRPEELHSEMPDRYGDKALHRAFLERWGLVR